MGSYKTRKNKHLGKHRRSKKHLKSKHAKRGKKTKRVKRTKHSKLSRKYKGGVKETMNNIGEAIKATVASTFASVTGTDEQGMINAQAAQNPPATATATAKQELPPALKSGDLDHNQHILHAVQNETNKQAKKSGMGPLEVPPLLRKAQSDLGPRASAHSSVAMGTQLAASSKKLENRAKTEAKAEAKKHRNKGIRRAVEGNAGKHASAAQIAMAADGTGLGYMGGKKRRC